MKKIKMTAREVLTECSKVTNRDVWSIEIKSQKLRKLIWENHDLYATEKEEIFGRLNLLGGLRHVLNIGYEKYDTETEIRAEKYYDNNFYVWSEIITWYNDEYNGLSSYEVSAETRLSKGTWTKLLAIAGSSTITTDDILMLMSELSAKLALTVL